MWSYKKKTNRESVNVATCDSAKEIKDGSPVCEKSSKCV